MGASVLARVMDRSLHPAFLMLFIKTLHSDFNISAPGAVLLNSSTLMLVRFANDCHIDDQFRNSLPKQIVAIIVHSKRLPHSLLPRIFCS